MSNCRLHYSNQVREDIIKHYKVDETSAELVKPNIILLPIGGKGNNQDRLQSIKNTNEWALRIKKEIDKKYNSKLYGSQVRIDNNFNPRGTLVHIEIKSSLIDAFEQRDNPMFQLDTVSKKNTLVSEVNGLLEEYVKQNNIRVDFLDSLRVAGVEPTAVIDLVNNVIRVNTTKSDETTLPEELGHHLVAGLGNDHTLVKRALNLIGRMNYREELGQSYIEMYSNDDMKLKQEYLGKKISEALVGKTPDTVETENEFKLWDTIWKLIEKFVSLFKPNTNIESELNRLSSELANMIKTGAKVGSPTITGQFFQLGKTLDIPKEYKRQYVYYKGQMNKLMRKQESLDKSSQEYRTLGIEIKTIQNAIKLLLEKGNKQEIINLSTDTLNDIEKYINKLAAVKAASNEPNYENMANTLTVLNVFMDWDVTASRARELRKSLSPYIKDFGLSTAKEQIGENVTLDKLEDIEKDMHAVEMNFGTLSDVKNYLAKTIGLLIKAAQAAIEVATKKNYNSINDAVEKLKVYSKSVGIASDKIYDVFIQEYTTFDKHGKEKTTTVMTMPYTSEFYKRLNATFSKGEDGKAERRSFATYNTITKEWTPKDGKYTNPNFTKIQSSPELKEFHEFYKSFVAEKAKALPIRLKEGFIPNIVDRSITDILKSDKTLMAKMKDSVNYILQAEDFDSSDFVFDEELMKDTVPLKYLGSLSPDMKSNDLGQVLLKFANFTEHYEHMSEILPKTKLLQEMIKDNKFIKSTNNNVSISGENSNTNKMVDAFINMQIKGEMKKEELYAPAVDFALKYTSLLRIGLNPFNALTNVLIGNIGNLVEGFGGRFFSMKQLAAATSIFTTQNFKDDSKLNKLVELINPLMELEDYENMRKIAIGSSEYKEKIQSLMYAPQRLGEKQMQTSTMVAIMMHDKITKKDSTTISMWEAFDEEGNWKESEIGYPLDTNMINKLTNKVQRVNQMIHGRYSSKDATVLSQYALFRAAFQFKKWIPAAIEARLGGEREDGRLGVKIRGRYRTYWRGIMNVIAKIQGDIETLEKYKWDETDIYNMRKNALEAILILGTLLMGAGFDDDKLRKDPLYKFTMGQLDRVSGDLLFFYSPAQMTSTASNGVPMLKTLTDVMKVFGNTYMVATGQREPTVKSGRFKGENRITASIVNVTPIIKPIADVYRLNNKDPYRSK
jgi:hypothetical protein